MPNKLKAVDAARFSMVPRNDVQRSAFDIQHFHKTTMSAGLLCPVYVDEVVPGDSYRVRMTAFARTAPLLVPMMDNLVLESHFFFVPNRLVWEHWERFMGEQANPSDTTDFLVPYVEFPTEDIVRGSIADYFGITSQGTASGDIRVNVLPMRGYLLIWNDWFRDEDLSTPATVAVDDGPDPAANFTQAPYPRAKRRDYFTTARPWPVKPSAATAFDGFSPLVPGGNMLYPQAGAPVSGFGVATANAPTVAGQTLDWSGGRTEAVTRYYSTDVDVMFTKAAPAGNFPDVRVLVNDIRTSMLIQALLERNSRGGSRYAEIVRSHFGVISPDARLQRPEFLGGGRTSLSVHPLAQTSPDEVAGTLLGEQAGIGAMMATDHGFSGSFTEHGYVIGVVSIRSDLTYQNGIRRMWWKRSLFEFYWPALASLGEQAIISGEIWADGTAADATVFGYQERYSEYKWKASRTSGFMRSTSITPLDMWHLGQQFATRPVLNHAFIIDQPPMQRVFKDDIYFGDDFLVDMLFEERLVRPMPMFSVPGLRSGL